VNIQSIFLWLECRHRDLCITG